MNVEMLFLCIKPVVDLLMHLILAYVVVGCADVSISVIIL